MTINQDRLVDFNTIYFFTILLTAYFLIILWRSFIAQVFHFVCFSLEYFVSLCFNHLFRSYLFSLLQLQLKTFWLKIMVLLPPPLYFLLPWDARSCQCGCLVNGKNITLKGVCLLLKLVIQNIVNRRQLVHFCLILWKCCLGALVVIIAVVLSFAFLLLFLLFGFVSSLGFLKKYRSKTKKSLMDLTSAAPETASG